MKLDHTPGPWKSVNCGNHWNNPYLERYEIHYGNDGECIADTVYRPEDARLIAAAPDMLDHIIQDAADELSNDYWSNKPFDDWKKGRSRLVKIIERATGMKIEEVLE